MDFRPALVALCLVPPSFVHAEPPPAAPPAQNPGAQAAPLAPASAPAIEQSAKPAGADLIGKPPPPIVVAKWVKGEPLTTFEKGTVYVVDFWATWCGPCKAAIPHLSRLAQAHRDAARGKVEVIGVSISEKQKDAHDTAYFELVQKFVDKQGEKMDYRVAVDTPDKTMHSTWFKPAGTGGIPTAYIIDKSGLVAWTGIGTPAVVERIVGEILAGTFDSKVEAARQAREDAEAAATAKEAIAAARSSAKHTDDQFPGYQEAMKSGNTAAAIEALNQAFKAKPELEYTTGAYQWKIMALMQRHKAEEVEGYLKDLLSRKPGTDDKNPSQAQIDDMVGFYSACLVRLEDETQNYNAALILDATKRAAATAKPDSRWQGFTKYRLGWAYWHAGQKEKATAAMEDAVATITRLKGKHDFGDLPEQAADALKTFKKAATPDAGTKADPIAVPSAAPGK